MIDHAIVSSVAEQMMSGREVAVEGRTSQVTRTGSQRLRTVRFLMGGTEYQAIEQNPEKPTRWGTTGERGASSGTDTGSYDAEVCGGCSGWESNGVLEVSRRGFPLRSLCPLR
jgi:hypothetical protein